MDWASPFDKRMLDSRNVPGAALCPACVPAGYEPGHLYGGLYQCPVCGEYAILYRLESAMNKEVKARADEVRAMLDRQTPRVERMVDAFVSERAPGREENWLAIALALAYFEAWALRCSDADAMDRMIQLGRLCVGTIEQDSDTTG